MKYEVKVHEALDIDDSLLDQGFININTGE